MKKYSSIVLSAVLTACGGGSAVSISKAAAVAPSTPEQATANLSASLDAIGFVGGFASFAPGASALSKANAIAAKNTVEKIVVQQDFSGLCEAPQVSENKVTCDCTGGGSVTISGDFSGASQADVESGNMNGSIKMSASSCKEAEGDYTTENDGDIEITYDIKTDSSGSQDISITMGMNGSFLTLDSAGTVIYGLEADMEIGFSMATDQEAIEAAQSNTDPNNQVDTDDLLKITQSIDGLLEYTNAEDTCTTGVYSFETIEELVVGNSCTGFKAGKITINGATYAFAESDVTVSGAGAADGTIACSDFGGDDSVCAE